MKQERNYQVVLMILNMDGQSEKQFKIQSHLGIFDPVIGEGQWYDDASSQALKCICEWFGNILLF